MIDRFSEKYVPSAETGCWIWIAAMGSRGYGMFQVGVRQTRSSHRMSWLLHRGPIPKGMYVCHKCDTPACVNPDHLFLGSHADNTVDMVEKRRQASGERHGMAKLTEDDVRAIRAATGLHREIAERFGIHKSLVSLIKRRKNWAYVA